MINLIKNEFIKLGKIKFIGSHLVFLVSIVIYYYVNKKVITEDFILSLIPFVGVVLSIIFCSIMSSEYTKGTFRIYLTKPVKRTKTFKAHDENNECRIGDRVKIMETRPLSKDKRFRLVEVVEKVK